MTIRTPSDLVHSLGDVPPERVLPFPAPGTATEQDVLDLDDHHDRICELVDGTLVEKVYSTRDSVLACLIGHALLTFILPRKLGIVTGEAGMLRLRPRLVRIPDVAFISYKSFPDGQVPKDAIYRIAPDLAVEVLSKGNTRAEMARKRTEYFQAGTRLVWEFDADAKTVDVYTKPEQPVTLHVGQTLAGDPVLPGLTISLTDLFAQLDQQPA
jgi:Uma2 family endonuclease